MPSPLTEVLWVCQQVFELLEVVLQVILAMVEDVENAGWWMRLRGQVLARLELQTTLACLPYGGWVLLKHTSLLSASHMCMLASALTIWWVSATQTHISLKCKPHVHVGYCINSWRQTFSPSKFLNFFCSFWKAFRRSGNTTAWTGNIYDVYKSRLMNFEEKQGSELAMTLCFAELDTLDEANHYRLSACMLVGTSMALWLHIFWWGCTWPMIQEVWLHEHKNSVECSGPGLASCTCMQAWCCNLSLII